MNPSCEQVATFLFLGLIANFLVATLLMPTFFLILGWHKKKVKKLESDVDRLTKVVDYLSGMGEET